MFDDLADILVGECWLVISDITTISQSLPENIPNLHVVSQKKQGCQDAGLSTLGFPSAACKNLIKPPAG
jgi:hypothetical protein